MEWGGAGWGKAGHALETSEGGQVGSTEVLISGSSLEKYAMGALTGRSPKLDVQGVRLNQWRAHVRYPAPQNLPMPD